MLIQFSFQNYLSFQGKTVIDMTAIPIYKEHEYNLILGTGSEKFLKVAAVYGANASGKSNLASAFSCFQSIVVESFNNGYSDCETAISGYYRPFLFQQETDQIEFEVILAMDGFEYQYGFEYNRQQIICEWLYQKDRKTDNRVMVFERNGQGDIEFGASVTGECSVYEKQILPETLVLSFFNRLKVSATVFRDVYNGILSVEAGPYNRSEIIEKLLPKIIVENKNEILDFFEAIDSGIVDIKYQKENGRNMFYAVHEDLDGKQYDFSLFDESDGTVKCIMLYLLVKSVIFTNRTLIIDELNMNLHPLLLKFIIDLFYEKTSTAQLIYTTHDTALLDRKYFRKDQIWFIEKKKSGCSNLYALSDFKVRPDASYERDYLSGVYGAIPLLKNFSWKEEVK